MKEATLGLYLHIPFCLAKCHYCDFCSFPAVNEEEKHAYAVALANELRVHAQEARDTIVDTIFFGGGTPTCLNNDDLAMLAACIHENYTLAKEIEWTCEANPATVDLQKLQVMRDAGFNRISLGMQSANKQELIQLGRVHQPADLYAAAEALQAAGFTNWNLDLMFGIPTQTIDSFRHTLHEALELMPTHLSVYALQIEMGTPFYEQREHLQLPDEECEAEMSALLYHSLANAGYCRYEISNFAKPGYESRHNLRYWRMQDYLGFGISAHSCFDGRRFYNRPARADYICNPIGVREEEEILTRKEREYETIMLGLRLADGIAEEEFRTAFGHGFYETYNNRLHRFMALDLLRHDQGRTYFTERGMALSNTILAEILAD